MMYAYPTRELALQAIETFKNTGKEPVELLRARIRAEDGLTAFCPECAKPMITIPCGQAWQWVHAKRQKCKPEAGPAW